MAETGLKKRFESNLRSLTRQLLVPCKQVPPRRWSGQKECYDATIGDFVQQSRDIKFSVLDEYDRLVTDKDYRRRDEFLTWLDKARLDFRNELIEQVNVLTDYQHSVSEPLEP